MASPMTQEPQKKECIDMHIGPTFDPEKYLDLERRMFKVEPRPIPVPKKSKKKSEPPKKTVMTRFIAATTKVACKLESILRAPFERFSSNHRATAEVEVVSGEDKETSTEQEKVEIKSPEVKRYEHSITPVSCGRSSERNNNNALPTQLDEGESHNLGPVIRKGHVSNLVKLYEEYSPVTSGASSKEEIKLTPVLEHSPAATVLQPEEKKPKVNGGGGNTGQKHLRSVKKSAATAMTANNASALSRMKQGKTGTSSSRDGQGRRERKKGFRGTRKLLSQTTRDPQIISI